MKVMQQISQPGNQRNEDLIWFGSDCAVMMDGSTSLIHTPKDAVWFVHGFLEEFVSAMHRGMPLWKCVNTALDILYPQFQAIVGSADVAYLPSASALFVRKLGEKLQILNIGDCTGHFYFRDGSHQVVYSPYVEHFDQQVIQEMERRRAVTGRNISDLVTDPEIRSMLIANRKKMNTPNGYPILSFGMAPCTPRDMIELPCDDVTHILLHSDGFSAMQSRFSTPNISLEDLYQEMRGVELSDYTLNRHPRFKISDDASAMLLAI